MDRLETRALVAASIVGVVALVAAGCMGPDQDDTEEPARSPSGSQTPDSTASESVDAIVETEDDIDVGGRELFLRCWGEQVQGEPTVLLIAGGGDLSTETWLPMAEDFAADGHWVCAYDRAGIGESDPAPEDRRTLEDQVADLEALLDAADLAEPVVLVAHSAGSLPAVGLVDHATDRVAGVVLVDPQCPRLDAILRDALPPEKPSETTAIAEERRFLTEIRFDPTQNAEHLLLAASDEEAVALLDKPGPLFGNIPVVVLKAPRTDLPGLPAHYLATLDGALADGKAEFVAEASRGTLVEVPDSGHFIHEDQPEVVMDAIRDVLAG